MNNKVKSFRTLIVIWILFILFESLAFADNRIVRVGFGQNPPLTVTGQGTEPTGLAIDVIKDVAQRENWEIEFVEAGWSNLLRMLEDGEIDILTGIASSEKRAQRFDFSSEPIVGNWGAVFRRPSIKVDSIIDLSGLRIAMGPDGAHAIALVELLKGFEIKYSVVETTSYLDVFDKLEKGEADVGVVSRLFGLLNAKGRKIAATGINFNPVGILFATPKGKKIEFLKPIDNYLTDGKKDPNSLYQAHLEHWVNISDKDKMPQWVKWLSLGAVFALFVSLLFVRLLRKQVQLKTQELQKSENRFNHAMKASQDGLYDWNLETNEIYYSPGWKIMLGYQDNELANDFSAWETLTKPEDVKRAWEMQKDLIDKRRDRFQMEFKMKHKNGHWVDILSRAKAIFDDDGKAIRIVGTHVDITERKTMEMQLYEKEEALRLALNAAQAGTWTWDVRSGEVYWDNRMQKIFGLEPGTFKGTFEAWKERVHPDDAAAAEKATLNALKTGEAYEYEYRVKGDSGEWRIVNAQAGVLRDENGNSIRMSGLATDITEARNTQIEILQQKRLFETMFNTIQDGVIITDKERIIKLANKGMETTFGYKADEIIGKSTEILYKNTEQFHQTGKTVFGKKSNRLGNLYVTYYKDKNGREFPGETFGAKLLDENNNWIGNLGIMRDISSRLETEKRLQQAQKMESIGNLAGGIAHDFNNILFPIIGMAELLLEDLPPESLEYENAKEIYNAGKRAGELVKQILAFSRKSEYQMMPTRVQKILKEVLKLCRSTIPTNIEIHQDIQQDCGSIWANSSQVHQIGMNLITNAYHAVQDRSGRISVELKEVQVESENQKDLSIMAGKYILFSVSDNGEGISPEVKNKIFEPYFTTKEPGKGTGLGLAVVYGIVKDYGGEIKVKTRLGEGTTFEVYLPIMDKSASTETDTEDTDLKGGDEHILLVDDESTVALLERKILERYGYRVTAKFSSYDALETFKINPDSFDLILSDMSMPNLTGDQLANEIKKIRPNIPIILCTGFSERINEKKAKEIGVNGLLMKPVVKSDLIKTIRTVLDESMHTK